jgi:hypothetical protein
MIKGIIVEHEFDKRISTLNEGDFIYNKKTNMLISIMVTYSRQIPTKYKVAVLPDNTQYDFYMNMAKQIMRKETLNYLLK